MAAKTATMTARIQPEVKRQAEEVLDRLGMPVSTLIDLLYRQIIMTESVPFPLSVPRPAAHDELSREQFDAMTERGYRQAMDGEGLPLDEAFAKICAGIRP